MPISFEFENKPQFTETFENSVLNDNTLQSYNTLFLEKFRLAVIDDEKLENYVKTRTIFNNITDLNMLAIRHSWATTVGTNYVVSLFPKKNNYVAVLTQETFLRPVKRTQKKHKYRRPYKKHIPSYAGQRQQELPKDMIPFGLFDRSEPRANRFSLGIERLRKRTVADVRTLFKIKERNDQPDSLRALFVKSARLSELEKKKKNKPKEITPPKEPQTLMIDGEMITLGSFFPEDYDEQFSKQYRVYKLKLQLRKRYRRTLTRHDIPDDVSLKSLVERNISNYLFSTSLPTIKRLSYKQNLYNFKRFIRILRRPKTQVLAWSTAGKMGFAGPKRPTPYASQVLGKFICAQLALKGIRYINIRLHTRVNKYVRSFVRGLHMTKDNQKPVRIHKVLIPLAFTHGHLRKRKQRRV